MENLTVDIVVQYYTKGLKLARKLRERGLGDVAEGVENMLRADVMRPHYVKHLIPPDLDPLWGEWEELERMWESSSTSLCSGVEREVLALRLEELTDLPG